MNELIEKNNYENMIYEIRGVQVMLDSDLARIYECSNGTKTINQSVKRNIKKFPIDFYFQLTEREYYTLKSQIGTSRFNNYGGVRKMPFVFTEQGVAMLATVIHTKVATEVSINIMRAFVKMRHFINDNKDIYESLNRVNNKIEDHDDKLNYLFSKFDKNEKLLISGEVFDGYLDVLEILRSAVNSIIVIDSYADISFLDLIRNIRCEIILITKNNDRLSNIEIMKYNEQYHNLKVIRNNELHDRFIVIDRNDIYIFGSSLNSLGKKITSIVKIKEENVKEILLNNINRIINN